MEQNTDRMGFALIALSVVAVVLLIMNTFFGPTVKGYFSGLSSFSKSLTSTITNRPNEDDPKWVVKSNYGTNGRFLMDKDGNAVVYASNQNLPITIIGRIDATYNNSKIKTITYLNPVTLSGDVSSFFYNDVNLVSIYGLDNWNTSGVTNMGSMFNSNFSLSSVDGVSSFDTSNVTSLLLMFYNTKITSLDLSSWNTSKVTDMSGLFNSSQFLVNITGLSSWDTSKVKDMSTVFYGTGLMSLDLSNWNTSNVTVMKGMFASMTSITEIKGLSDFDVRNVTNARTLFYNDQRLKYIDVSNWAFSSNTDGDYMFWSVSPSVIPSWYKN